MTRDPAHTGAGDELREAVEALAAGDPLLTYDAGELATYERVVPVQYLANLLSHPEPHGDAPGLAGVRDHCGYSVTDRDGNEEPCGRPIAGWRWYQDVEHEDLLETACDRHRNEGGRRIHATEAEVARLRARVERVADCVTMVERIHEAYGLIVMDTDEDRERHTRLVDVADRALTLARAALEEPSP